MIPVYMSTRYMKNKEKAPFFLKKCIPVNTSTFFHKKIGGRNILKLNQSLISVYLSISYVENKEKAQFF